MVDLHAEADRHAAMVRPHLEQTGGLESFFIAARPGQAPLALPATFDTVEAKEEGLDVFRALFQELGCSHVAWISEAWVAASSPALADMSPRDRPDRTEALMIVVEDAAGLQAVRIDAFARIEGGGVRWGEPIRSQQAERRLMSGDVEPALRERARLLAREYQPRVEPAQTADRRSLFGRLVGKLLPRRPD